MYITEKQRRHQTNRPDPTAILDPESLFRMRYMVGFRDQVVPELVIHYIPFSVIKSLALAFDPFAKFRTRMVKVTPVNRTRTRTSNSVLSSRLTSQTISTSVETHTIVAGGADSVTRSSSGPTRSVTVLTPQSPLKFTTKDTTARTRVAGSEYGELESFSYSIVSPGRNTCRTTEVFQQWPPTGSATKGNWGRSTSKNSMATEGPAGLMFQASLDSLKATEMAALASLMPAKALKMLPKVIPTARDYTIFRNVVELRDIPGAIHSLRSAILNFREQLALLPTKVRDKILDRSTLSTDIPSQYVSYWFGWNQLYKDVMDLLATSTRITKRVNYLITRNGKPTTFRTRQKYPGNVTTSPSFSYATHANDTLITTDTIHSRELEFRLMLSARFDFPPLAVPELRKQLFLTKLGVLPTVTDIYNLIPWSWLVDWFTGLGNYVEAIDAINTDPALINYGFLTAIQRGKITTTRSATTVSTYDFTYFSVPQVNHHVDFKSRDTHQSILEYKCQIRKDVVSAYNAKSILELANLSPYQTSILGAIVLSRNDPSAYRRASRG